MFKNRLFQYVFRLSNIDSRYSWAALVIKKLLRDDFWSLSSTNSAELSYFRPSWRSIRWSSMFKNRPFQQKKPGVLGGAPLFPGNSGDKHNIKECFLTISAYKINTPKLPLNLLNTWVLLKKIIFKNTDKFNVSKNRHKMTVLVDFIGGSGQKSSLDSIFVTGVSRE